MTITIENVLDRFEQEAEGSSERLERLANTQMTLENCKELVRATFDERQTLLTIWVKTRAFIRMTDAESRLKVCDDEIIRLTQGHPEETKFWTAVVGR
jgi:hypothetical protein